MDTFNGLLPPLFISRGIYPSPLAERIADEGGLGRCHLSNSHASSPKRPPLNRMPDRSPRFEQCGAASPPLEEREKGPAHTSLRARRWSAVVQGEGGGSWKEGWFLRLGLWAGGQALHRRRQTAGGSRTASESEDWGLCLGFEGHGVYAGEEGRQWGLRAQGGGGKEGLIQ